MKDELTKQGYSPEEEYFYRKNQEAIRKLKEADKRKESRPANPDEEASGQSEHQPRNPALEKR